MAVSILEKSPNRQIVLACSIPDKSFFDAATEIAISKYSGVLKITSPKNEFRLFFKEGNMIYSDNSQERMELTILKMVRKSGLISRETMIRCEKQKSKIMKTLLEILIDEGALSMLLYSKILTVAVMTNLLKAMLEKSGDYSFELKTKIDEVRGVKTVKLNDLRAINSLISKKYKATKQLLNSIYYPVATNDEAPYLKKEKSLFQNFLMTETDFLKYFASAAEDFAEKKWTTQSKFKTESVLNSIALVSFRTVLTIGLCIFLYLATTTITFDFHQENQNEKDFYFLKINLLKSLIFFEEKGHFNYDELLNKKLVDEKELKKAGIEKEKP